MANNQAADREFWWWAAVLGAIVLLILINPGGFIGGGQDDWQYLNAARCWRSHGPCLPLNHWQGRWPVIAPLALVTAALGESRFTVSLAPLLGSLAAVALLVAIGNRLFGRPVGFVAGLLFLTIPAFCFQLLQPSVESIELTFIFAACLAYLRWRDLQKASWAFATGLCLSLAIQVRETAAVAALLLALLVLVGKPRPRLADLLWGATGFITPFIVEFVWFQIAVGDPLWRRHLSIAHTRIPSSELLGPIDTSRPPFFNKSYIANWRIQPGIHLHWTLDGLLNLFANTFAGISLSAVPLLLIFGRRILGHEEKKTAWGLWLGALLYALLLFLALALDPKPRIALPALAMTTLALAMVTWRLRQAGYALIAYAIWFAAAVTCLALQLAHQRSDLIEAAARDWIKSHPGQIETEGNTRRYLELVPDVSNMPGFGSGKRYLLVIADHGCSSWQLTSGIPSTNMAVERRAPLSRLGAFDPSLNAELCLFRYAGPVSREQLRTALQRNLPPEGYNRPRR
jgi:hypothetical protein